MAQSILYYPTIDIPDGAWLRCAALYWDEVCSIVPYENYADFSPEVSYLQQRGHYRPIYPHGFLHSDYATEFLDELATRINRINLNQELQQSCIRTKIHFNKISGLVFDRLPPTISERIREFVAVQDSLPEWLEIESAYASIYIRTLAEYVANYDPNNVIIGTDSKSELNNIFQRSKKNDSNRVITLSINQCLPIPKMSIGFEEILDFKESHQDELFCLRSRIHKLELDLSHCESIEEIKLLLSDFTSFWGNELEKAEKMFSWGSIPFILGSLKSLLVDAGGAAGLVSALQMKSASPVVIGAIAGTAGLVGVGVEYRKHTERIKQSQKDSGFAYLISAAKHGII